ncbi:MAG: copper resistance protein NlpE N-terminal domain-containing protein [Candidatus Halalkalibacterium sp. M3_1C_030]
MEKELAGKSYGGITPCADCEGIALTIHFFANSRYESQSMYIGESNKKFVREGSWKASGDSTITLMPSDGDPRRLKVHGNEFLLLDRSGKEIEGNLASNYMLRNIEHRPLMGTKHSEEGSTINFKAHGNEPFWGLEIDMDSLISFKAVSGDSVGISMAKVKADSTGGVVTFLSKPDKDSLNIELHPVGCMDSMSGQVYDYRVLVNKGEREYSGCGSFVQ